MFINRHRIYNLTEGRRDLKAQFRWETINAASFRKRGWHQSMPIWNRPAAT
jgi:hypothetical protein